MTAVVLAAGGSSRMGRPKMLVDLGGTPLVRHAVDAVFASRADEIVVVTGAASREVEAALDDSRIVFAHNPDWESGIAGSIRSGVLAANESHAALVVLGDQPMVTGEILDALIDRFHEGHATVACEYEDGTLGPPALFGASPRASLLSLAGDQGARILLRASSPARVPFPGGALDVDTPADLARAARRR